MELSGLSRLTHESGALGKFAVTAGIVIAVSVARLLLVAVIRLVRGRRPNDRISFWTSQGTSLAALAIIVAALLSIWLDDPRQLQMAIGLVTAGLAIASQKAVTAFAAYLVIMRGKTFTVGDRIKMGGVQGDVIALGFLQTRILEMGQPPPVNGQEPPGMWIHARQFSGRIVTVTNDKVFDEPVYNFTREFRFIWEELRIGVGFRVDHARVERILLDAVHEVSSEYEHEAEQARQRLERRFGVGLDQEKPRVYWRITDNWLEMAVRFVVPEHGVREVKDRIARRVLPAFNDAGIDIASTTFEVVGLPPVQLRGPVPLTTSVMRRASS